MHTLISGLEGITRQCLSPTSTSDSPIIHPSFTRHVSVCLIAKRILTYSPHVSRYHPRFTLNHPLVNTRTTALTSVPHASFALRFSDLSEVEAAVHEDEEQRAGRTLDWIGSRIATQSARWVEAVESSSTRPDDPWRNRTPWWDEVKRCVQGDNVPNRVEGWNHPVSSAYRMTPLLVWN